MIIKLDSFITADGEYVLQWDNVALGAPFVFFKPNGFGTQQGTVSALDRGYNEDDYVTSACSADGTFQLFTFNATLGTPFIYIASNSLNSTACGFSPTCDLAFTSIIPTDCTTSFNNNGVITAIATTSAGGLLYSIDNVNFQSSGVFSNLIPGTYTIYAKDNNGCHIYQQTTIFKFHLSAANEKYEVSFTTQKDNKLTQLKIYDSQNTFSSPIQLTAQGSDPIEKIYRNDNENKYTPIIACSVNVNLVANGLFDPNEFEFCDERRWKAEIYIDSVLDFQGWVIPDEMQDIYSDGPYPYQLVLTDGLPSLKGVPFTDLNGIRIFGLGQLLRIWQYCFANLGYDIGTTTLISSLTVRQASDMIDQWNKTLVWSDQFYDEDGIPDDFYTVLEKTMVAFGLTLFQHKGNFYMVSSPDLYHNMSGYAISFDQSFTTITTSSNLPGLLNIGRLQAEKPVNPTQTIRIDKAISVLNGNVDFVSVALLNQDPSFEYGSVAGNLPVGWEKIRTIPAEMVYDPINSYLGDWVFRIHSTESPNNQNTFGNRFVQNIGGYLIDQVNKKVKFSFAWKPSLPSGGYSAIPVYTLIFFGDDGNEYWQTTNYHLQADIKNNWVIVPNATPNSIEYFNVGGIVIAMLSPSFTVTTDFSAYQSLSIETGPLPTTGRLYVRFSGAVAIDNQGRVPNIYPNNFYVDIDDLQVAIIDAQDDYSLQVKETHQFTNLQTYAKAETAEISASFYTYIRNKYISGNVLYGTNYSDSVVTNDMWKYTLANGSVFDKLPKAIFDSIARNYQRPMVIWEGDVRSDVLDFFKIIAIDGYPGKKFMIISLTKNYKESICTIVAIEIENTSFTHKYTYIPKYNKSTRRL